MQTDIALIKQIADRAVALYAQYANVKVKPEFIILELRLVHEEMMPLMLRELLDANDADFAHDIGGIHQHVNIGRLEFSPPFTPRFVDREAYKAMQQERNEPDV